MPAEPPPDRPIEPPPGGPRRAPLWVRISLIAVLVVAAVLVVLLLLVGGDHGPGRHALLSAPALMA